ncbi:MAG TPA: iron-containing alcohol dehydrogenase family protein [Polyangiaceae bacterium]
MNIVIPSLLRIKPNALNKIGKYLRMAGWSKVAILWGEGLEARFGGTVRISCDATDIQLAYEATATHHDAETLFRESLQIPASVQALVALGGGRAIDCAKYMAHLLQKPLMVVPTAISNDGFCSPFSSLLVLGKRRTVRTVLPEGIVLDTEILRGCPEALLHSGVGDLFCKYTAIFDWKLAFAKRREPVNDFAAEMALSSANTFLYYTPKQFSDLEYLRVLARSLMMAGIAMEIAGSSRPASGAEHLVSHAYDQVAKLPSLHGIQVGVASYLMSRLQQTTEQPVLAAGEQSGFFEYVATHPLERESFIEALKLAPSVKQDFYTILSEPDSMERALRLCDEDAWMQRLLA